MWCVWWLPLKKHHCHRLRSLGPGSAAGVVVVLGLQGRRGLCLLGPDAGIELGSRLFSFLLLNNLDNCCKIPHYTERTKVCVHRAIRRATPPAYAFKGRASWCIVCTLHYSQSFIVRI